MNKHLNCIKLFALLFSFVICGQTLCMKEEVKESKQGKEKTPIKKTKIDDVKKIVYCLDDIEYMEDLGFTIGGFCSYGELEEETDGDNQ